MVTACRRGNLDIICVVLGCDTKKDRTIDSIKLINYVFKNFSLVNVKDVIVKDFENWISYHNDCFIINKGISNHFDLYLNNNDFAFSHIAINNSHLQNIETEIVFESYFQAPVSSNEKIGKIDLKFNDELLFSVSILNNNSINKKNYIFYIIYIFKNYCNFFNNFI